MNERAAAHSEQPRKRYHVERFELDDPEWKALLSQEMDDWLNSRPAEWYQQYAGHHVAINLEHEVVVAERSSARFWKRIRELGFPKVRSRYIEEPGVAVIYAVQF